MDKQIRSSQNPLIKKILLLQSKSRERKKLGTFIVEGLREIQLAKEGKYQFETILFCDQLIKEIDLQELKQKNRTTEFIEISLEIYQKIAHRKTTEGLVAVAFARDHATKDLVLSSNPLILVAEAPEKPGNLGALFRTADAANIDAVIIANPKTDLYNPNIIRSSVGCVFTNQIATGSSEEIIGFLKKNNLQILTTAFTEKSMDYLRVDYTQPTAIVVGTEDKGLEKIWIDNSSHNIIIPMQGKIDSLNVSVSAAILIFEAKRQRNFN